MFQFQFFIFKSLHKLNEYEKKQFIVTKQETKRNVLIQYNTIQQQQQQQLRKKAKEQIKNKKVTA